MNGVCSANDWTFEGALCVARDLAASAVARAEPGVMSQPFTSANALTTLLTVESLMFSALTVAVALSSNRGAPTRLLPEARRLAIAAAIVLTVIAFGATVAWCDTFLRGDASFTRLAPAICIVVGILTQPGFAWRLAFSLRMS